jgi:hypothetical protein
MSHPTIVGHLSAFLAACTFVAGCGSGGSGTPRIASIVISAPQSSIAVSGTDQFTATAEDRRGNPIAGLVFTWSSTATNVRPINSGGAATGMLPGATQVTASADGMMSNPVTLPVTPGFISTGSLNAARFNATATLLNNGMVLVAGGNNTTDPLASAELFNPATGTFTLTDSLNTTRYFAGATLLSNGMVLIAGGLGSSGALASAELYDPVSGTFTPTGSMNAARGIATATLLNNGMVLVAGGFNSGGTLAGAELYNPLTGAFALTGSMATARYYQTATLLNNGMVLIAGGALPSGATIPPLATAELYDPATGAFTATGNLNAARLDATAALLSNGTVLLAGGDGGNTGRVPQTSAELYDPISGAFTATGSLNTARLSYTATLLPNGTVLITAGLNGGDAVGSVELYNGATSSFTAAGHLATARFFHTATLLANGTVVIAGGLGAGTPHSSTEIYNPVAGTISPGSNMTTARKSHAATLLDNGQLLIVGGAGAWVLSSAELY